MSAIGAGSDDIKKFRKAAQDEFSKRMKGAQDGDSVAILKNLRAAHKAAAEASGLTPVAGSNTSYTTKSNLLVKCSIPSSIEMPTNNTIPDDIGFSSG